MPDAQEIPSETEIKEQRTNLERKYGKVARRRRQKVDQFNIASTIVAFVFFGLALIAELWASGWISVDAFGIGSSRDYSSVRVTQVWFLPQAILVAIGLVGLSNLFMKGYYSRGLFGIVVGAMHEWENHIREIRERDPNKVGLPLTHLLSLAMTVRRVAAHTYFWAVVWGILAFASTITLPSVAHRVSEHINVGWLMAAPTCLAGLWGLYLWRGHVCQWTFLPVPEILRQFLVLIYLEKRDRGAEAYVLADAKLNESVHFCPECYLDRNGRLALLASEGHPRDV